MANFFGNVIDEQYANAIAIQSVAQQIAVKGFGYAPGDELPDPRASIQREFDRLTRSIEHEKGAIKIARNALKDREEHIAKMEQAALKFRDWLDRN